LSIFLHFFLFCGFFSYYSEGPALMTAALDGTIKIWQIADVEAAHGILSDKQMKAETELGK
jgi:hypothetical protein